MRHCEGDRVRRGDHIGTISYSGYSLYVVQWDTPSLAAIVLLRDAASLVKYVPDPQEAARLLDQQRREEHAMRYL